MGPINATRPLPGPTSSAGGTPVKSILKATTNSSGLGKRTAEDAGIDGSDDSLDGRTKRRKVFFDEVQNKIYEVGNRTMEEVKREVREALEEHRRGNDGPYDTLKELFGKDKQRYLPASAGEEDDALKPQELRAYVVALTSYVPALKEKDCNGLVKIILKCSWLGRDEEFLDVYTYFLAALISAQGTYLTPVLSMMVDNFTATRPSMWNVAGFPEISRETMRGRLHKSIRHILKNFPAAISVLEHLLANKFPFPDDSLRTHMAYIHNLFRVKEYAPQLREEILDLILNRVVKIDAQMQLDLEDVDDDITAAVMYTLRESSRDPSQWEDDDDDSDTESVDSDDADYDAEAARIKAVKENVEKMDAILDTLFTYFTPLITPDPGSDRAYLAFTTILREFEHMVLPTFKSRHTQFLIFHFAQMHERLSDAFCGQMIQVSFDRTVPSVLRQACVAYLASFVARGAHVPRKDVQLIFELIVTHMNRFRDNWEASCRGPDLKRFSHFYTLAQAAMYIFCFRWQDLVVSAPETVDPEDPASYIGQDLEWYGSTRRDLRIHVFSIFNPLKVCAPVIVEEFAKLAHRLNFMYVFPLVEANKRLRLTQFMTSYATGGALRDAGYEAGDESLHQLDPYFPFDPYQLPFWNMDWMIWDGILEILT
ncbi:RNA polymerase I-specific transcription initiation factor-like protein [Hapsidospora chrysogenum ATCC 11550]|uniref:RNA polymerase I-specific transcription initiation factor-like protein n=1 Tax=Hapsidospora chrysogenum (strain ATCC 11550 / CBS 779.69 / DSM 880 / IAM 14645 / JCM 23072 / IMI 49137) TaxID=857340 RepID=A0A086TD69_HAPC1|nr:RNA polymerase I-specific transcription initiation factor-like protein [Hapsidospora chrysogenum ATCC 11550]